MNYFKEGYNAALRLRFTIFIPTEKIWIKEGLEVLVHISDDALLVIGVPPELPGCCVKASPTGEVLFCVNKCFMTLENADKRALLAHEIGHVQLGHMKLSKVRLLWTLLSRNFMRAKIEFDADRKAAQIIGKEALISALVELGRRFQLNNRGQATVREIEKRIEALRVVPCSCETCVMEVSPC